jgi:hypothetical protein
VPAGQTRNYATRWLFALAGILLLPVCLAATASAVAPLAASGLRGGTGASSPGVLALAAGVVLWLLLYFTLPRPVRSYVLAHELTHALWGWLLGARVHGIQFSRHGGQAQLSKTNVLIALAPYFCPFYTVVVIAAYGLSALCWNVRPYALFWLGLVGLTWSFHITFTVSTLRIEQPDLRLYGAFFSLVLIYLLNVIVLAVLLVSVTDMTFSQWGRVFGRNLWQVLAWVGRNGHQVWSGLVH